MSKPKRGHEFYHKELKKAVWLYRMVKHDDYLVSMVQDLEAATADDLINVHPELLSAANKPGSSIKSKVKVLSPEAKQEIIERNVFFASQIRVMPFLCDNCQQPFYAFSDFEKRCCIAQKIL